MKYLEDESRGRCLECGDVLPYGRSDMKFCCVTCKSRYHYVNSGHLKGLRLRTIGALDRNHGILMSLLEKGVTSMNIPDLAQMGYRFDCVTSYHKVRNVYGRDSPLEQGVQYLMIPVQRPDRPQADTFEMPHPGIVVPVLATGATELHVAPSVRKDITALQTSPPLLFFCFLIHNQPSITAPTPSSGIGSVGKYAASE